MAIQMTRAEYEAKYGKPPVTKPAATADSAAAPQKPLVKMTRAEYKAKYGTDPVIKGAATAAPAEEKDGILETIVKDPIKTLLVKPAARFAEAVGRTGVLGTNIKRGYEEMAESGQDLDTIAGKYHVEGVKPGMEGVKQIAGEAAKTASYLYGGGAAANTAKTAVRTGLGAAVRQGVKSGAVSGGLYGGGDAAEKGGDALEIAEGAVKGGLGGAAAGAAIPVLAAGASKAVGRVAGSIADRAAKKAEQAAMLENKVPDASIATKALNTEGKVVTDKVGKEAVRQGIPEADVALIKNASDVDKSKMLKMLEIRKKSLTNKRVTERSTDVVGDTFLETAKFIEGKNKQAGKDLNMVAQKLQGKKADPTEAIVQFGNDLDTAGIKIGSKGKLNFRGSDFEGITPAQRAITQVWSRVNRAAKSGNALELHRLKSYIDEIVNYGKSAEGLSGKSERILKTLRHNIDGILDKKFPQYNKVNTIFSDTIKELNNIGDAMSHSFKLGDSFANAKIGTTMRRVLSNTQSRAQILQMLESMQKVGKKYGFQSPDDIITQTAFADTLEKLLGSEAPSSFLGNIEKGVDRAGEMVSAGNELARGNLVSGTIKVGKYLIDATRGINQDNKLEILRALLEGSQKPKSVFGKPVTK